MFPIYPSSTENEIKGHERNVKITITQKKRERIRMEWNETLQAIIDYVENHLQCTEEPVDNEEISRMAGCSFDFFQKVFSYMNGVSFAEYVRARKLTLAGYDIKSTDMKIVDISYKYGYNSPTSFTKAFRQFHGLSPREARESGAVLRVLPKMQCAMKEKYSWRIMEKPSFHMVGKSINISCADHEHYQKIPAFWDECQKNGIYAALVSLDKGNPKGLFGIFGSYDENAARIEYSIMVISDQNPPCGFDEMEMPEATWAVFDCTGPVPEAIQKGWKYLNEEWFVKYPFRHAPCPELEWYSDENAYGDNYLSQIWIPVLMEE